MSWRPASRKDFPSILPLAIRDEARCVPFSSRFKHIARGTELYVNEDARGGISECLLMSAGGLILPVFDSANLDTEGLRLILRAMRPCVHSIMGVGNWVRTLEDLLPLPPSTRVEYFLMNLDKSGYAPSAPARRDVRVRRATPADALSLFPLQKSYEMEEVVINPSFFDDAQCMRLLVKSLREELFYIAEKGSVPVSKAGTNARGYRVDQIGGVFTVNGERGKGLAAAVMHALLADILSEKEAACLFVKKANKIAISLYERLGFKTVDDYVISYYGM